MRLSALPPHPPAPGTLPCLAPTRAAQRRAERERARWVRSEKWWLVLGGDEGMPSSLGYDEAAVQARIAVDARLSRLAVELGAALDWALAANCVDDCRHWVCCCRVAFAARLGVGLMSTRALERPEVLAVVHASLPGLSPSTREMLELMAPRWPGTVAELVDVASASLL